jgi:PAS domain S-box-containing protein
VREPDTTPDALADGGAALRASERRFRRLFEACPFGMVMLDADLRFRQVNRALADMLGYTEDELIGRTIPDVTHPDDLEHTASFLQTVRRSRAREQRTEKRYIRKDGSTVWGRVTALGVRDENGEVLYALGIVEDVTERRDLEEALRQAEEVERARAIEQARLEGVLLTARETADRLGNALSLTRGYGELVLLESDLSSDAREKLVEALRGVQVAVEYLHTLQQVTRVATKPTPFGPVLDPEGSARPGD